MLPNIRQWNKLNQPMSHQKDLFGANHLLFLVELGEELNLLTNKPILSTKCSVRGVKAGLNHVPSLVGREIDLILRTNHAN